MKPRQYCTLAIALLAMTAARLSAQTTRPAGISPPPAAAAADESKWLKNVRQLTSKTMGLDRSGEAYFSADQRRISFQAYPTGQDHYQIYVMNLDGTGLKMVSTGQGACTCSYFHPSGDKMLFASNYEDQRPPDPNEIHRRRDMPENGGAGRPAGEHPAGAPKTEPGGPPAATQPAPGAAQQPPTTQPAGHPGGVPKGATHGGRGYVWDYYPGMEIYEYTFATGALKNLTHSDKYDAEGSYSPDGKLIVFSSLRDGQQRVYIMNADGSNPHAISSGPGDGGPFFTPDGQGVIYRGDRRGTGNMQVFVNNLAGTAEKAITPNDALYWCPYWHPSGKWIAFTYSDMKQMPPRFDVYLMRADGTQMQRVTSAGDWNGLPVFSPDGKHLLWTSKRGQADTPQIFIADFVGLTPAGELVASPSAPGPAR